MQPEVRAHCFECLHHVGFYGLHRYALALGYLGVGETLLPAQQKSLALLGRQLFEGGLVKGFHLLVLDLVGHAGRAGGGRHLAV